MIDFYVKILNELRGFKILGGVKDRGEEFFGLKVEKNGDAKVIWFLMDDEGNGPGSFEIQELN